MIVIKRDGHEVPYDGSRITEAVLKAMEACGEGDRKHAEEVRKYIEEDMVGIHDGVTVEDIQDLVETALRDLSYYDTAKAYCIYREERLKFREANSRLMKDIDSIINVDAEKNDRKRENANIDGNAPMGAMLQIGADCAKAYNSLYLLRPEQAKAHQDGDIHIHDFDFYALTETCCQIDILRLFHGGFSTGHGFLREPQSIQSYAALAAIAIQANQNDQHESDRAA